jgi:hypothetical protein
MSDKPRPGEIIIERFAIARAKNGAGYVEELAGKPGADLRVRRYTQDLAAARRFASGAAAAKQLMGDLARDFEFIACTAEIRVGPKPKAAPPAHAAAGRKRAKQSAAQEEA